MRYPKRMNPFAKYRHDKEFQRMYREERARIDLILQIIELRKRKKLTQAILARKAGMKQSALARIESGNLNTTIDTLNKIAVALNRRVVIA